MRKRETITSTEVGHHFLPDGTTLIMRGIFKRPPVMVICLREGVANTEEVIARLMSAAVADGYFCLYRAAAAATWGVAMLVPPNHA